MAVSKKAKKMYYSFFDGSELFAANTILKIQEKRDLKKHLPKEPIPKDYSDRFKSFWGKYGNYSPEWGWYYVARNGIDDVSYIPHTLYYTKIDQHFNSRKLGWGFNDKNYYAKIFNEIKQPTVIVRCFGSGIYTDDDYHMISSKTAIKKVLDNQEVICKPTQESGSGRGIQFWKTEEDQEKIIEFINNKSNGDYIVQKLIKQHKDLADIHENSVNTIRVCSLLLEDGVHILSAVLRMGVDKSRVDNATAGGITCGINPDGTLQEYAYSYHSGEKYFEHPQGYIFAGHKVPSYDKAVELVEHAHQLLGHFRLTSWDIAIDESGDPVLIEANMRKGSINFHQFSNGPLFGDLTEKVLHEVFEK